MKRMYWLLALVMLFQFACRDRRLIMDKRQKESVHVSLEKQKELLSGRKDELFEVIDKSSDSEEEKALEFLLAYMPLNDMIDYSGEFFRTNVRMALKARKELSWGKNIPSEIFYHFVLPYRASNENLDNFRTEMYDELKERVQGMNMRNAALEINHWCHEKVTYRSSSRRTSSPLSLMKTSWGRCGEEAVLTVMAMRTVGIPARQCYTPRWAHTDDNHAWVEVWVNGEWHFMGACEPEPELNMGWFAEPVTRAMIVNSVIFGDYNGNETVNEKKGKRTTLNVTANYAPVKKVVVKVVDESIKPVKDAIVRFKIYNYGELSTIAAKTTDKNGFTDLTSGLGDYIIWATDSIKFGFKKVTVNQVDTVGIVLSETPETMSTLQFDLVPPINHKPRKVDAKHRNENKERLKEEDTIRKKYMDTFIDSAKSEIVANRLKLDTERIRKILDKSKGNWETIVSTLEQGIEINKDEILDLLEVVSDKDLRDTPVNIFIDHLKHTNCAKEEWKKDNYQDYVEYVLNPRIAHEILTPYRSVIQDLFNKNQKILFRADPGSLVHWVKEKIKLYEDESFASIVISPVGVAKTKIADLYSMNIFFIATCRSLGIPARYNQESFIPEYFVRGEWRSVRFKEYKDVVIPKGKIVITTDWDDFDPMYYKHWTLARFENGNYRTVGFDWETKISYFKNGIELNKGYYMLTTGIRKNNGTVPCKIQFFTITENETTELDIGFRKSEEELKVLGEISLKTKVRLFNTETTKQVSELLNGNVGILAWIDPDKEPTKHVMEDLKRLKDKFEEWGGTFVLMLDEEAVSETFVPEAHNELPENCIYAYDVNLRFIKSMERKNHKLVMSQYPIVLIADAEGQYYYYSNGYKIGIGEQLIKTLKKLSSQ